MKSVMSIDGMWLSSGGKDDTSFVLSRNSTDLAFSFIVKDANPHSVSHPLSKRDLEGADRVEVFFSQTNDLSTPYFCIEIDPLGRVLDYRAEHYRHFDFSWHFTTLRTSSRKIADGFRIDGTVSLSELASLGISSNTFFIGVFKADFDEAGENVVWGSAAPMNNPPDFHHPDMFLHVHVG